MHSVSVSPFALLRPVVALLLVELVAAPPPAVRAADRRVDPDRLTIATFNALFLFDGREPEGDASFPWKGSATLARRHLRDVATVLRRVDADLVHLSEVEDLATLERLRLEIGDPSYRAFLVPGRDSFTRQNVGLLARVDPESPLRRTDESAPGPGGGERHGVSKHYVAHVDVGGVPLALIGIHLLAFVEDPERVRRREAQAEVIRRLAVRESVDVGRHAIVLGDFNDRDASFPDASGRRSRSAVLSTIRSLDRASAVDDLVNPAASLPQAERFTAFVDRNRNGIDDGRDERSLTDHILVAPELASAIVGVEVLATHALTATSDHLPLRLELDLTRLSRFLRGDAEGDLDVDTADAVALLEHLFGGRRLPCHDAADLDDDGRLALVDALDLLNHLHLNGPRPPAPGTRRAGLDPTADALGCR